MPEIDGYGTFSALQRISPDVKVIISSGYSEEQVLDHFADRAIAGFLHKPYFQAELATIVRQALQRSE
ncbi:MAG: response regulator [Desulfoprunum sp.]|nr:response regulator [Desulfoprunum sp.]